MVPLQLKDPSELFVKNRQFPPGSGFLSRRDMTLAVESDPGKRRKNQSWSSFQRHGT